MKIYLKINGNNIFFTNEILDNIEKVIDNSNSEIW